MSGNHGFKFESAMKTGSGKLRKIAENVGKFSAENLDFSSGCSRISFDFRCYRIGAAESLVRYNHIARVGLLG